MKHQKDIEKIAEDGYDKINAEKKKNCMKSYDSECSKKEDKAEINERNIESPPSELLFDNAVAKLVNDADVENHLRAEKAVKI